MEQKLQELMEAVYEIRADLREHMLRTKLNEERIEKLEKWHLGLLATLIVAIVGKMLI